MKTLPFAGFEWTIAARYLRAKRRESFISVIAGFSLVGIALGVAVLIIVMSVMNGFRQELLTRILGLSGHMNVQALGPGITDYDNFVANIRAIPGVINAVPVVEGQVMASSGGANTGVIVRGMRREDLARYPVVAKSLSDGALQNFKGSSVIIGQRLANRFGLGPGMQITLIAAKGDVTPFGTTPRVKSYTIAGTFEVGMSEYDAAYVFMPLAEAQRYFGLGDMAQSIEIMVTDPDRVNDWRDAIISAGPADVRVFNWQQMNSNFFEALMVERNVMFLILTLIILVAALNTVSGLIMLVKDKTGDIAILRTMGATKGAVMRVFFIAGSAIGVTGTFVGVALGVVFCLNIESIRQFINSMAGTNLFNPEIYFLSRMPAEMDASEVIAVVLMSLGLSLLATLYPSWRAAKLDPVEALRYE